MLGGAAGLGRPAIAGHALAFLTLEEPAQGQPNGAAGGARGRSWRFRARSAQFRASHLSPVQAVSATNEDNAGKRVCRTG